MKAASRQIFSFVAILVLPILCPGAADSSSEHPPSIAREACQWGNVHYVDFAIGETHSFLGRRVRLEAVTNNFCTVSVDAVTARLRMARRDRPAIVNGVRIFLADTRPVAQLTAQRARPEVRQLHAAMTRDALLCLSDPAKPLVDPQKFTFPISRRDGFRWKMGEESGMFGYIGPDRTHEGMDIDMSEARGREIHPLVAIEDATVRWVHVANDFEACALLESAAQPGIFYIYQHLNQLKVRVKKGDRVRRGQEIAYIWGDWRWGHLHFAVIASGTPPDFAGKYQYVLNCFPQLYELWHGSLEPVAAPVTHGQFRFGREYWLCGEHRRFTAYSETIGFGWQLGNWCAAGCVEFADNSTPWTDQGARLRKIMHRESGSPAVNPNNCFDFEVAVENGNYYVQAEVGDEYIDTWQRVEIEGVVARAMPPRRPGQPKGVAAGDALDLPAGKHRWLSVQSVPVTDGRLTVRIFLKDDVTPAAIRNLDFTIAK